MFRTTFGSATPYSEPSWYRGLPSPYYKASHQQLRQAAREWTDTHLMDVPYEWEEETKVVDPAVYAQAAKDGIVACLAWGNRVPKQWAKPDGTVFGGVKVDEWDGFHDMILIDELHRCGSLGVPQGLFGGLQIGCPPIYTYGSPELQARVLPEIMSGKKRVCLAITEPEAGSDVKNLSCEAKLSEDGQYFVVKYVSYRYLPGPGLLTANSLWLSHEEMDHKVSLPGIYSDYFTTAVRTSGKPGEQAGISLLLIPKLEGVVCRRMSMSGQHCAGTTFVTFEDVKVPVGNLLGKMGEGFRCVMSNFNHERLMIIYVAQRLARVCIEDSLNYANKRKVFGKKLVESEVIRHKFAHMARNVEAQQAWIESVVYQLDNLSKADGNRLLGGTTALLKAHASLTLEIVAREAVQVMGGIAHTKGGIGERVERVRRDVKGVAIPGGSEEVLLDQAIKMEVRQSLGVGSKL
ncbi:hypothetical protein JCM11641_001486 [Rhodosporidiobolus odoratus]